MNTQLAAVTHEITIEQSEGGDGAALSLTIAAAKRIIDGDSPTFILTIDQASAVLDEWRADSGNGIRGWTTNDPECPFCEFILASAFDDQISFASWSTYWSESREGGFSTAELPFTLTITEKPA